MQLSGIIKHTSQPSQVHSIASKKSDFLTFKLHNSESGEAIIRVLTDLFAVQVLRNLYAGCIKTPYHEKLLRPVVSGACMHAN